MVPGSLNMPFCRRFGDGTAKGRPTGGLQCFVIVAFFILTDDFPCCPALSALPV